MMMNADMQDQHNPQYIGLGKVKKVMVLKTSEEVKQTRTRERQRQRYQAMQQTMLKAVEQAVVLSDPKPRTPCEQEQTTTETKTPETVDTQAKRAGIGQSLIDTVKGAQGSVASFFNRMYTAMMEED